MNLAKRTTCGILVLMAIAFAGFAFVYAQTAADADFDGDGTVGFSDFVAFAGNFGTSSGDGRYEAKYDLNGDGQVGFADFVAFAGFFGKSSVPNDPPVLERIGDQGVPIGVSLNIELAAADPDGDDLRYRVSGQPPGASFSGTTFQWTPRGGVGDVHRVTFSVDDGRGGADSETIAVRVVEFRFKLVGHRITTEAPSFVNILFQVLDFDNWGVTALTTEHFEVRENEREVSPTESAMRVQKRKALPHRFKLKTVLMLDTSTSVKDQLEQIKEAAIVLVENMSENQEIALYEFSENPVLLQDFTNDVEALTKAIREIRLGFPTTNLYGSIITGTGRWQDVFSTTEVEQGFLVILTDGSDTQGSYTLSEALEARGNKNIYTIGLGNEIDPEVLEELGNAGFFQISDVTELADRLAERFIEIQKRIVSFADSFYWLRYLSPKRGDREHTLLLTVKDNEVNYRIRGRFNSEDFYSVRQGVFVNPSPFNSEGIEELRIAPGDTVYLLAVTYLGTESPQYHWESSNNNVVSVEPDSIDAAVAWVIAVGDSGQTATISVFDHSNRLDNNVQVRVEAHVHRLTLPTRSFALPGGASMEMVWVPPGTFQMGSPTSEQDRLANEGPPHKVTIRQPFYLGIYEVTQAQWESVMNTSPWKGEDYVRPGLLYPVYYVSWEDAQEFIRRLNGSLGSKVYRLPTEAEWEYACRAGTGTFFSFGDDWRQSDNYVWSWGNAWHLGEKYAHEVGRKRPNPWGLYDMHGNVAEWVQDCWNHSYEGAPADGSAWETGDCSVRVIRGGTWAGTLVRSAARNYTSPTHRSSTVGFRVARTVTP